MRSGEWRQEKHAGERGTVGSGQRRDAASGAGPEHSILALQHTAGNAAVAAALSGEHGAAPSVPVQRAPGDNQGKKKGKSKESTEVAQLRQDYNLRLSNGPLLSSEEQSHIERADPGDALRVETGTHDDAQRYLNASRYYDWLQLPPGKRLFVATLAWEARGGPDAARVRDSPAYVLARGIQMHSLPKEHPLLQELEAELNVDVRDKFAATLASNQLRADQDGAEGLSPEQIDAYNKKNQQANTLLRRLFVIIQQGLEVAGAEGKYSADRDWRRHTGNVARALAHGGRVNVRVEIPHHGRTEEPIDGTSLPTWLDMYDLDKRPFSTHDVTGGNEETLRERGGHGATIRKLVEFPRRDERGADVAAGGIGSRDFNGDVVLPNGMHGHILLVYRPPTARSIGVLEIGMETTAPESVSDALKEFFVAAMHLPDALRPKPDPNAPKNPVGYRHTAKSTEKTANPASSFGGLKQDKLGVGKLDTMRVTLSGDWLRRLKAQDEELTRKINKAGQDEQQLKAIFAALVGTRDDFGQFLAGEPPATAATAESADPDRIEPAPA
ncbi:hypothetical protein GCM10022225_13900 [Plantactinospora mayteni]|uniref:Novel toxin 11 domain-containing protein n=1 Tax=Plantactinospora mayteni TaxID=566021 RepID=A0ABQ4EFH1_9ACTN|nr:hypothetical protein [Plantactinospora mayteni]GIG93465.1 hypothetical protein Pma05_00380 [Plantactinospora mayteni]